MLRLFASYCLRRARLLGVSEAKFSLIMKGKQKPDVYFIKAVHEKLEVDANTLLKAI